MFESKKLARARTLVSRVSISILGQPLVMEAHWDKIMNPDGSIEPRVYLQIMYNAPNTKDGTLTAWKARKWYLSEFMTDDEIVKTAYLAFRTCIEHEVLESFKIDGIILFNPHVDYTALLEVSHRETKRTENEYTSGS